MSQNENENKQKILLVDDNDQTRKLMKKFFIKAEENGDIDCEVLDVNSGKQAIKTLSEQEPDLIICDINMPDVSGFDVLQDFNKNYINKHPFCFFAFLSASDDEKGHAFKQNVMGFLSKKEMNYFVLLLQVKTWLRLAKLERQREGQADDAEESKEDNKNPDEMAKKDDSKDVVVKEGKKNSTKTDVKDDIKKKMGDKIKGLFSKN